MRDFWRESGYHLLTRDDAGRMAITDDFLRAYLNRPEVRPVEESCAAERQLHAELMQAPRQSVPKERLAAFADPDAAENYRIVLGFRDRLIAAGTVEGAYLDHFLNPPDLGAGAPPVPPLFLDQLAQVVVRSLLEGCEDALRVRAGELLFREQQVTINEGHIMVADSEVVEMYAATGGFGSLGKLIVDAQTPVASVDLDVIDAENADLYWAREARHDTVLNLSFASPGLDALCRVLEGWIAHFLEVQVSIQPVQKINDERWVWHSGLDVESTRLLNDLYNGVEVGEERLGRLLSLFRLDFADPSLMRADVAGRPVYLAMAMGEGSVLHLKPQNLLVNLPLAERA